MRDLHQAIKQLLARLAALVEDPAPGYLLRLQELAPDFNGPAWLGAQSVYPKLFWRDRRGDAEVAVLGSLVEIAPDQQQLGEQLDALQALLAQFQAPDGGEVRCYGGMAFNARGADWPGFGYSRWLLPLIERGRSRVGCWLACHLDGRSQGRWQDSIAQAQQQLNALLSEQATLELPIGPYQLSHQPVFKDWQQRIEQALQRFSVSGLDKVVLARQSLLLFRDRIEPWALLAQWQQRLPQSNQFAFAFSPEQAFIGCSPEQLFRRIDRVLYTEALAGSCARGLSPRDDQDRAKALLDDQKNRRENRLVLDSIHQQLAPLTERLETEGGLEVLKLARIQHLRHRLRGLLLPEVSDTDLLLALHPTPAVGGYPREDALAWLEQSEPEQRGWYAGVVAALGLRETQAIVAIRSALVEPHQLTLFAGAGIVPGSEALPEWLELDNKIETVMGLFKRACA